MGGASQALYFLVHPYELKSVVQWKVWHDPVHKRDLSKETATEKSCFHYLDLTSRSFSTVIQELNPELLMPVTLFYLVLRALDTVEDDMTLDLAVKEPILRDFHNLMEKDGWTFDKSGPNEKDRELLVHFDDIITELKNVKRPYYAVIKDIAEKMGNGMADYVVNAEKNANGVESIADYELYCHYVAGLVGEGLTRLFVESNLANPQLLVRMDLTESMGQFLQKTNIIRDVHEDFVDGRRFWPKEIWSKHVDKWEDMFKPECREKALNCSSEMVLNALKHADECLYYMAGVRDQSVFNFVAIPQSMAIATLELVFRNPAVFEKNIKITKGDACQLMTESTQSLRVVCDVFRQYARRIHAKNDPRDPLFMEISAQCGKIEQFIESIFPTQDPKKLNAIATQAQKNGINMSTIEVFVLITSALVIMLSIGGLMIGAAYLMGARWGPTLDALGEQVRESSAASAAEALRKAIPTSAGHSEL